MAALWVGYWLMLRQWRKERAGMEAFKMWTMKKARETVEQRCQHCQEGAKCLSYNNGVNYQRENVYP